MKSALITAAIFAVIVGGVLVFERKPASLKIDDEESLKAWIEERVSERRAAEETVERAVENSPDAIPKLFQMASDADNSIREEAVRRLAKTGRDDVIQTVRRAFSDRDEDVRKAALWGMGDSLDEDPFRETKTTLKFKQDLFDVVAALTVYDHNIGELSFTEENEYFRHSAIQILPRLNGPRAAEFLQRPNILRTTSPDFEEILAALSDAGVPLSVNFDNLLTELRPKALANEHPYPYFYGELLRAIATQKHPRARELIQEVLDSSEEWTLTEKAAEAQWILLGLSPTLDHDIFACLDHAGPDRLGKRLQQYVIVSEYFYDAMNGGHSQYFLNPYSNHVRANITALKEMGAERAAYDLVQSMKLFGPTGPPVDQMKRRELMYANDSKLFDLIDGIEAPDSVKQKYETIVHAKLFLAKHADVCKKVPRYYP